jgi:pilus assembly protein Flp/PilA
LKTDRRAVTALEYGLIAGLIALVIIDVLTTMGSSLISKFTTINSNLH